MNQQQMTQEQIAFMLKELEQRSVTRRAQLEAIADMVGFAPLLVAAVYRVLGSEDARTFGPNMTMEKASAALVNYYTAQANDFLQDKKSFDLQIAGLKRQLSGIVGARVVPPGKPAFGPSS
jgi:hypothetical protein